MTDIPDDVEVRDVWELVLKKEEEVGLQLHNVWLSGSRALQQKQNTGWMGKK